MRTVRTAGLVGGLATGALLLAGTAAQAADTEVPESTGDLVMATPEALGGLPVSPDAVTGLAGGVTDQAPGLSAVDSIPGANALVPSGPDVEAKGDIVTDRAADEVKDQTDQVAPAGSQVDDLLSGLGGGLPVPLPF
ncbi:hypothetical protein O1R50_16930 [Glycomyces luteolus]|uniref:ATP-binding protein n=1 Tax=Glycomyces luteolus TaxID=2670330 RepID=A0A9X3SR68_9ACTN|nr:hypothetical protein [Glycomyces luteolus]MDA1361317.1 hypothetical protein [Glycomyces luteolus]